MGEKEKEKEKEKTMETLGKKADIEVTLLC